jgi:hypothetical protein
MVAYIYTTTTIQIIMVFFPSLESGHGFFFFSIANYKNTMTLIIFLLLISFLACVCFCWYL